MNAFETFAAFAESDGTRASSIRLQAMKGCRCDPIRRWAHQYGLRSSIVTAWRCALTICLPSLANVGHLLPTCRPSPPFGLGSRSDREPIRGAQDGGQDKTKRAACHETWCLHKVWHGTRPKSRVPSIDVDRGGAWVLRVPSTQVHAGIR